MTREEQIAYNHGFITGRYSKGFNVPLTWMSVVKNNLGQIVNVAETHEDGETMAINCTYNQSGAIDSIGRNQITYTTV